MVGAEGVNYPLPRLPQVSIPEQTMQFHLRLADAPGAGTHGLGEQPWLIVRSTAEPEGMALMPDDQIVLRGTTDGKGAIQLDAEGQEKLQRAYCEQPGRLWVMQPGYCARLAVVTESAQWTGDERLRHLMSAADFSADVHASSHSEGLPEQVRYAKDVLQTESAAMLVQVLKSQKG